MKNLYTANFMMMPMMRMFSMCMLCHGEMVISFQKLSEKNSESAAEGQ